MCSRVGVKYTHLIYVTPLNITLDQNRHFVGLCWVYTKTLKRYFQHFFKVYLFYELSTKIPTQIKRFAICLFHTTNIYEPQVRDHTHPALCGRPPHSALCGSAPRTLFSNFTAPRTISALQKKVKTMANNIYFSKVTSAFP